MVQFYKTSFIYRSTIQEIQQYRIFDFGKHFAVLTTALAADAIANFLKNITWWVGCTIAPVDNTTYYGGELDEVIIRARQSIMIS